MLRAFGGIGSSAGLLPLTIPVFSTFFFWIRSGFCADGAVQSPTTFFSAGLLLWGLFNTRAWGMAAALGGTSAFSIITTVGVSVGGIGQDTLALNRLVEAGMVIGHGVSSLFCGVVAVTAAYSCCSWGL